MGPVIEDMAAAPKPHRDRKPRAEHARSHIEETDVLPHLLSQPSQEPFQLPEPAFSQRPTSHFHSTLSWGRGGGDRFLKDTHLQLPAAAQ